MFNLEQAEFMSQKLKETMFKKQFVARASINSTTQTVDSTKTGNNNTKMKKVEYAKNL